MSISSVFKKTKQEIGLGWRVHGDDLICDAHQRTCPWVVFQGPNVSDGTRSTRLSPDTEIITLPFVSNLPSGTSLKNK